MIPYYSCNTSPPLKRNALKKETSRPYPSQGERKCTIVKGRKTGGFQTGGLLDLDFLSFPFCPFFVLVCPFLSFLGLSRFFRDFPDLPGDSSGIFPICPFPLSRPLNSAYEERSRNGPRHNSGPFPKKVGNPPVLKSPSYAAPIGAFFCPEMRAFTGFVSEISSTVSKVFSDCKVQFKHENGRS